MTLVGISLVLGWRRLRRHAIVEQLLFGVGASDPGTFAGMSCSFPRSRSLPLVPADAPPASINNRAFAQNDEAE